MTTHDRKQRDCGRVRRWCAALRSRPVLRIAVLTGFSGIAWLAGVAGAQAEPVADAASPDSSSQQSPVAPVAGAVSAESEQAALTPANQLESGTLSILDAPGQMLSTSKPDTAQATHSGADTTVEVPASNTGDSAPSTPVSEPGTDATALEPLRSTVTPVADRLAENVGSALEGASRPIKATARPVGAALNDVNPTAEAPMLPSLLSPMDGDNSGFAFETPPDVYDGEGLAKPQHDVAGQTAESVHTAWSEVGDELSVSDTLPRPDERSPLSKPAHPKLGYATTGVVPAGIGSHGPAPADSGAGPWGSDLTVRDATVSRVAPSTAAFGQLPDHIADPAVSPD